MYIYRDVLLRLLHISLSNKEGKVVGGHLKEGCIIYTTAEIIIGNEDSLTFNREVDEVTTFKELVIKINE